MINLPYKPRLSAMEIYDIYSIMAGAIIPTTARPNFGSHLKAMVFKELGHSLTAFDYKPTVQFCDCPLDKLINHGCKCGGV